MEAKTININLIKPDENQPRKKTGFEKEELEELSHSIKQVGIIVPLLIQQDYTLIDGERRWRAAKLLGLKEVPVIFDKNLKDIERLEYQLICSLNSTSCAEEEIAPKIKEYIKMSGYTYRNAALRLGRSHGYIERMIDQLADLSKPEKEIISLWRETKGEKGIAPSNLAEVKQQHPEKVNELIEIAKEGVVTRSEIREIAQEKAEDKLLVEQKKKYEEAITSKDNEIKIIRTGEVLQNLREEISTTNKELDRFFYKIKAVKFAKLSWRNSREKKDFAQFVDIALKKAKHWTNELERIKQEVEYEN